MSRRKWLLVVLAGVFFCAAIMTLVFRRDIAIWHHQTAMMHALQMTREIGPTAEQERWLTSYDEHKDALVRYGYFVRKEFPLTVKPPETGRVWKQLCAEFPDNPHTMMQTTQWGGKENKIVVWDRPDRISAWEAAIRKCDVPESATSISAGVGDGG